MTELDWVGFTVGFGVGFIGVFAILIYSILKDRK